MYVCIHWAGAYVCGYTLRRCICTYIHVSVEAEVNLRCHSFGGIHFFSVVFKADLSLAWSWPRRLGWLMSKSRTPLALGPSSRIRCVHSSACLFHVGSGD